jgi:peptidoglycan hydrolase-like protein with peptidoglycan-binding domain
MNSGPRLAIGALGRDVQRAQTIFVMMKTLGFDQIDGVFGAVTKNVVIAFQQSEGLVADGVIGDDTWKRMPADPDTPLLRRGGTGNAVSGLQKGLLKFGGAGSPTDRGAPDGKFGPRTEAAVKAYQTQHSLPDDGVVGPRTWLGAGGRSGCDPGIPGGIDDGLAAGLIMAEPILKRGPSDPAARADCRSAVCKAG